jgi:hypothetical protein
MPMPCSDHAIILQATAQYGRRETAVLRCGLEKNGMASVNQTRPHCVNQMGKTNSKPLAARHGTGTAWARHRHGMLCVNRPLSAWERLSAASRSCRNFRWRNAAVHFITEGIQQFHSAQTNTSLLVPLKSHRECCTGLLKVTSGACRPSTEATSSNFACLEWVRNFTSARNFSKSDYWLLVCPFRLSQDGFSWNLTHFWEFFSFCVSYFWVG